MFHEHVPSANFNFQRTMPQCNIISTILQDFFNTRLAFSPEKIVHINCAIIDLYPGYSIGVNQFVQQEYSKCSRKIVQCKVERFIVIIAYSFLASKHIGKFLTLQLLSHLLRY